MKVLFIGNSHTYFNDMPALFKGLCLKAGIPCDVAMVTIGGIGLDDHAKQPQARFNILYGEYDYVVLQHRAHPMGEEENFRSGAEILCGYIRQTKARPVFYMTWAEKRFPENQAEMTARYRRIAAANEAKVAPVGVAWQQLLQERPEIELFYTDGEHASPKGSLLAACCIFSTLTGKAAPCKEADQVLGEAAYQAALAEDAL